MQLLASATAGLIVSKRHYTDGYEFARRLEPMDLAAEFRWALLPPLTMWSPRVRIAGMLEPAYEIAGDAFDYAVNGDVAHVAMFDAVGHGMRACRIANLADRVVPQLLAAAARTSPRPREAIDATLIDQFGESWFVTALLGELDIERGRLRFMSAGHPLPMLLRSGKVVGPLETRPGLPLGLGGPAPEVSEAQLEPDDTLFVYSDGVTEARSGGGDFFGEDPARRLPRARRGRRALTCGDGAPAGGAAVRALPGALARRRHDAARQLAQAGRRRAVLTSLRSIASKENS